MGNRAMSKMIAHHDQTASWCFCGNSGPIKLRVLGRFELVACSESIHCGRGCQRLLILLAIRDGHLNRAEAAGLLWPDVTMDRAHGNLRSMLWRMNKHCEVVIESTFSDLQFARHVVTDIQAVRETARRVLDRSSRLDGEQLRMALACNFYDDIAPYAGDEEWLAEESTQHRQLRIHALEALSDQLIAARWFGAAAEAALAALRADPYRESAYTLLLKAYLGEGNNIEARRVYERYHALLREELGVEPSPAFKELITAGPASPLSRPGEAR